MTVVFRLFRQVPTSQRFRSYTAWPNRAEGSFSQLFRSFDPKVRPGPTEPFVLLLKYTLFGGLCQAKSYFFIKIAFPRHVFRFSTAVTTVNLSSLIALFIFFSVPGFNSVDYNSVLPFPFAASWIIPNKKCPFFVLKNVYLTLERLFLLYAQIN